MTYIWLTRMLQTQQSKLFLFFHCTIYTGYVERQYWRKNEMWAWKEPSFMNTVYVPVCLWESCLPSHTGNHHSSASVVYNLQHWTNSAHGFLVWQAVALRSLLLGCLYPQAPRKQLCYRPETMRNLYRNKVRHIPF